MSEAVRNLAVRWFEEVWNRGRRDAIREFLSPDCVIHDGGLDAIGPEGFYPFFDRIHAAFSELHLVIHDTLVEGDRVCVRWSSTGKHTGDGLGIPPTGKSLQISGISIIRVANGKLVEGWQNWDMLGMMQQIQGSENAATYITAR